MVQNGKWTLWNIKVILEYLCVFLQVNPFAQWEGFGLTRLRRSFPRGLGLPGLFKQHRPRVWGLPGIYQQPLPMALVQSSLFKQPLSMAPENTHRL